LFLVIGGGCSDPSGLQLEPVSGVVTYHGKPLPGGTIVFHPTGAAQGPQAVGAIQKDGAFEILTLGKPGAVVGTHRVTISYRRALTPQEAQNLVIPEQLIPETYGKVDLTPLSFSVRPGGDTFYEVELKDDMGS
jgi:hypothetical protein